MDYYYKLPQELRNDIESYLKIKPNKMEQLIKNPPIHKICITPIILANNFTYNYFFSFNQLRNYISLEAIIYYFYNYCVAYPHHLDVV